MKVIVTLDYELFSGSIPGTVSNCIVKPMNELCRVADKYNLKYVVFVDAACLLCLYRNKELSKFVNEEYTLLVDNIKFLVKKGHDIQLHFHPQWIYTKWNVSKNGWDMDIDHYMITKVDRELALRSVIESKKLLESITGSEVYAYRGCGYVVEEFAGYRELFEENHILVDSSVLRNSVKRGKNHHYDYRIIPSKQVYRFDESIIEESLQGKRIEMSISTAYFSLFEDLFQIRPIRKSYKPKIVYKDGKTLVTDKNSRIAIFRSLFKGRYISASLDGSNSLILPKVYNKYCRNNSDYLVIIGHPKNASDQSIKAFDSFLNRIAKGDEFITTKELLSIE